MKHLAAALALVIVPAIASADPAVRLTDRINPLFAAGVYGQVPTHELDPRALCLDHVRGDAAADQPALDRAHIGTVESIANEVSRAPLIRHGIGLLFDDKSDLTFGFEPIGDTQLAFTGFVGVAERFGTRR